MTAIQLLREVFRKFTNQQKANVRMHLDNGVSVLAGEQAHMYASKDGGL